jgi:hypothetical protein
VYRSTVISQAVAKSPSIESAVGHLSASLFFLDSPAFRPASLQPAGDDRVVRLEKAEAAGDQEGLNDREPARGAPMSPRFTA